MKAFSFLACLLITLNSFGQTSKSIEADLLKAYKKIGYCNDHQYHDVTGRWSDSLEKANIAFCMKLKSYTEKYPFTITQNFTLLKKEYLDISTSDDGLFRIYSWDTWMGGTTHYFESVFQYKVGTRTVSILDTPKGDGDNRPNYRKLYTFDINNRAYYLCTSLDIGSTKDFSESLQVFDIENGKLNQDARIIKTASGMHSLLNYWYDGSISDREAKPIRFDKVSKTIRLPLISSNGKVTKRFITYKFTGQYFERVKN